MKRLIRKARLPVIEDLYDRHDYDTVDIGIETVNVLDIIGLSDTRVDEYNDDWSPKDKDEFRWNRLYKGYQEGDNIEPIPLIKTPDGTYFPDGDGNHRASVLKILNVPSVRARVRVMVPKKENINQQWEEYSQDKYNKLYNMEAKYRQMVDVYNDLMDKAFETGSQEDNKAYKNYEKELDELANEMNQYDEDLRKEENDFKQNLLNQYLER
jgi:hypothetical protein